MDLTDYFVKQGLGWAVAVVEFLIIIWMGKYIISLHEKRVSDITQTIISFITTSKDLVKGSENTQRVIEKQTSTLERQTDLLEAALRKT